MADETKYPTRIAPYGLRMPPDLKARIEASAAENHRSLNAEIVDALSYLYPAPKPADDVLDVIEKVVEDWQNAQSEEDFANAITPLFTIRSRLEEAVEETANRIIEEREDAAKQPVSDKDIPF